MSTILETKVNFELSLSSMTGNMSEKEKDLKLLEMIKKKIYSYIMPVETKNVLYEPHILSRQSLTKE